MPLSALITAAGCTIVLNAGQFAGSNRPLEWPLFAGEEVICFEPGVYPNWGGWSVPGGTAGNPVRVVALVEDVPWKIPREERVVFLGYTQLALSHNRIERVAFESFGTEPSLLVLGMSLTAIIDPPTVDHTAEGLLLEGGLRYYAVTMTWNSTIENSVIRDADPPISTYNQGGISIFRDNNTIRNVEIYDRGSDCIQVAWENGQQSNILIDGLDCYQTGKRYVPVPGGMRSCSEDGIDIKTGTPHAQYDGTNGNVIRNARIWGMRNAAGGCEGGGGPGTGILMHFGNTSHWTIENVDVMDVAVCYASGTKANIPPSTTGTPSYVTYRNVRCIEPVMDSTNLGWGLVVPPFSEVINATVIRAPGRWGSYAQLNTSLRCTNVVNSATYGGILPDDTRRTLYYGNQRNAYTEVKKGERVVWANAPLEDIQITRKLLTGPETVTFRAAASPIDWRSVLWGDPCDPGTSLPVGAGVLP